MNLIFRSFLGGIFSLFIVSGCVQLPEKELSVKPDIAITPSETIDLTTALADKFQPLGFEKPWDREMTCGWVFAKEGDFYRAITCFRKGLIYLDMMPEAKVLSEEMVNQLKIESVTGIIASYVFHKKYDHAIEAWETFSPSISLQGKPEAKWLLIMMVQAFSASKEHEERASAIAAMLPHYDPDRASLLCYLALRANSILPLKYLRPDGATDSFLGDLPNQTESLFSQWKEKKKNPALACGMNILIPGSGYAYIGQWPTAFTSLTINGLFIGATVEFFKSGQPMAALITLGLELGWWGGGAIGARLSTQEYNHHLWLEMAKKLMKEKHIYPEAILWKALHP